MQINEKLISSFVLTFRENWESIKPVVNKNCGFSSPLNFTEIKCSIQNGVWLCLGDDILHKILLIEEELNFEMVWKVVDSYMEAIILAREIDMEVEAIALSRLGSVYDKILKDKIRAKTYFRRSIQLAMSLHPRTFDNEGNCETNFISGFSVNHLSTNPTKWSNTQTILRQSICGVGA